MIETNDEQREFDALSSSVGLELLELCRIMHRDNGIDMADAWQGLSSDNATVVLGAMLRVLEAALALGAGSAPGAFEHRVHVLREVLKTLLTEPSTGSRKDERQHDD